MSQPDPNKTVFISYRRAVAWAYARLVFENLKLHGFHVFMDTESPERGGIFGQRLKKEIKTRTHFIIILTPGTVERCNEPTDWVRQEIEYAMEQERNIVPIMVEDFSFRGTEPYLTGQLAKLSQFNAARILPDFFDESMERVRTRFLRG